MPQKLLRWVVKLDKPSDWKIVFYWQKFST